MMHLYDVILLVVVKLVCVPALVLMALLYFVIHGERVGQLVSKCRVSDLYVERFRLCHHCPFVYPRLVVVIC